MARLVWDRMKERTYETGTDRGVLYVRNPDGTYSDGVVWNGLTTVTLNPSGAEASAFWADNVKYLNLLSAEELSFTIEAYSYPRSFRTCLGRKDLVTGVELSQQKRDMFGFSFRSLIGNAEKGSDYSYKIHVIYGCLASPSERSYTTVNDSPEAMTLSWEVSTLPIKVDDAKTTAEFEFDGKRFKSAGLMNVLHAIEDILYGTDDTAARMILPEELPALYTYYRYLRDSDGEILLDNTGEPLMSAVYD